MVRIKTFSLEEVKTKTNINLEWNWDIFLSPFEIGEVLIHEDSCILNFLELDKWDEELCDCSPIWKDVLHAKLYGWLVEKSAYFLCNIPENLEDFKNEEYKLPYGELPKILQEDILNAICTTAEMLKVYEKTGDKKYDFFQAHLLDGKVIEGKELQQLIYS